MSIERLIAAVADPRPRDTSRVHPANLCEELALILYVLAVGSAYLGRTRWVSQERRYLAKQRDSIERGVSEACLRDTAAVTEVTRLDPSDLAQAVRALLLKETERVDDPRPIPEDQAGWHAIKPLTPEAPGAPYYDPESWRWFELVDVGFVDEMVLIVFRWTDPSTPELRYSSLAHADGLPSAETAAVIVRSYLRRLLEPGWRDRVSKRWLSNHQVLIWRDPTRHDQPPEVRDRRARFQQDLHDAAWIAHRDQGED